MGVDRLIEPQCPKRPEHQGRDREPISLFDLHDIEVRDLKISAASCRDDGKAEFPGLLAERHDRFGSFPRIGGAADNDVSHTIEDEVIIFVEPGNGDGDGIELLIRRGGNGFCAPVADADFDQFRAVCNPGLDGHGLPMVVEIELENGVVLVVRDKLWELGVLMASPDAEFGEIPVSPVSGAGFDKPQLPANDRAEDEQEEVYPERDSRAGIQEGQG